MRFPDQYLEMLDNDIRMNVYTEEMAKEISYMARREGKTAYLHIKLDTGMARLGFAVNDESVDTIARISKLPNVNMEGVFTHFAKADETDKTFTENQISQVCNDDGKIKGEGNVLYIRTLCKQRCDY